VESRILDSMILDTKLWKGGSDRAETYCMGFETSITLDLGGSDKEAYGVSGPPKPGFSISKSGLLTS